MGAVLGLVGGACALFPSLEEYGRCADGGCPPPSEGGSVDGGPSDAKDELAPPAPDGGCSYAHPPVMVEVHSGGDPQVLVPAIHAAQNRAFTDAFVVDVGAGLSDDPTLYDELWSQGYDALQSDRPDLVLRGIGRWPPPAQP